MTAALLDEVLDAHGGEERWRRVDEIVARVQTGGLLPRTRAPGDKLADANVSVSLDRPRAVFDPLPTAGKRAVFDQGDVRIESSDGELLESRRDARSAFSGPSGLRRNVKWDALDTAYFAGYAMWNYLSFPLLLTLDGVEVGEGGRRDEDGSTWRALTATFDESIPTHSADQTFWIDERGLLRRHDYTAMVVSRFAAGAHLSDEHIEAGGLTFPTVRRVVPRAPGGRTLPGPTVVSLRLSGIEVTFED
ncbi:MAG: hypothetical protein ACR2N5_01390 [Solirubrobacterales bacterium]